VRYDLYADNDELFAKLRGGNPGYDVIFPTNDYVERMIAAEMLLPLDHARAPTGSTSIRCWVPDEMILRSDRRGRRIPPAVNHPGGAAVSRTIALIYFG
jgi:hypothetical protein